MTRDRKPNLLFAAYMAGGNATILQNLECFIGKRPDVDSAWLPIEMDAESQKVGKKPPRSIIPGTVRNSLVTSLRIRELERAGSRFDAAYFFQQTICMLLWRFRSRVPYVIAMDGTPLWYAKNDLWYALPTGFDPGTLASRIKHELTRRVFAGAFHLLPLSWSCRQSLVDDYGVPAEKITVIPPGIDVAKYDHPDRGARRDARRALEVLFVGADFVRKGGGLMNTLARDPRFRDVRFNLVTKTYQGPAAENIHVFDDLTSNSERLIALFRSADVFVLPTRADSHAIATLEAMATGLPVITTPVGGVPDVVVEGETGYLVAPDDLDAVADRLQRLVENPDLRLRMGASGRRRVETRFNAATISESVVELMKRAAASKA
jgi:glycosyltransferase involved in cell wall biosynthesis